MIQRKRVVMLEGTRGPVVIDRNSDGIPEIRANSHNDLYLGQGYMHALDRQLQVLLTRILVTGHASEYLAGDNALVEVDRYMRRLNLHRDLEEQEGLLGADVREQILSYIRGFNLGLTRAGTVPELRLLGYSPGPLEVRDVLVMAKVMGFIGLGDAQGAMEKLIVQMVQHDIEERKLRELFPFLVDKIDHKLLKKVKLQSPMAPEALNWLGKVPKFIASNNWVVSGKHTRSGKPMLCNDPHLEVNRLPSIWYEILMRLPHDAIIGASLPGAPGVLIGRNRNLAFGVTFAFMDMIDYFVEDCKDGKYRRGNKWVPFKVREERITVKKKGEITERVYENDLGILEGDPHEEGMYLVMRWAAARNCGAGDMNYLRVIQARTVTEAMALYRTMEAGSWNMVMADADGNIGYQMTGRLFKRPSGVSGMLPLPAWDKSNHISGFIDSGEFPARYNPPEGYIVTANQNLNSWGKCRPINLPMAPYRANRIIELLRQQRDIDAEYMKKMHFDLYSLQAKRFLELLKPLIPDSENGRILRTWDCHYTPDSRGATLFESVYRELLLAVFGDHGMGREVMEHLLAETAIFNDYYGNFDDILAKRYSAWFDGKDRDEIFRAAIVKGLDIKAVPYAKTRKILMNHLLFGGKIPPFLGFDRGPFPLPGNRATIPQGQIFRNAGRTTSFSPSYRIIADLSEKKIQTTLAGGPSDRRFSRWYFSDFKNWLTGKYKTLE